MGKLYLLPFYNSSWTVAAEIQAETDGRTDGKCAVETTTTTTTTTLRAQATTTCTTPVLGCSIDLQLCLPDPLQLGCGRRSLCAVDTLASRAFQFAIQIDSIRVVMRIDSNLFVL